MEVEDAVYALLSNKQEISYRRLINELKDAALNLKLIFAHLNAFKNHFPRVKMIGCFFFILSLVFPLRSIWFS